MLRTVTPLLIILLVLPVAARAADGEDAKLAAFFRSYLDKDFEARPLEATRAGDHRFDHLLDDVSPKARAARRSAPRKRSPSCRSNRLGEAVAQRADRLRNPRTRA